ncbi:hypothetical protein CEXT_693421 [Caerostris extrusa]|uniref:Secreted protein n=1 Tax=Caerostris extrusa TaxID=172846 RepID=A0AAV4Q3K7_CAEEX|nr:hypothetical protein CEXT_693421 [Caerostris extrusa]
MVCSAGSYGVLSKRIWFALQTYMIFSTDFYRSASLRCRRSECLFRSLCRLQEHGHPFPPQSWHFQIQLHTKDSSYFVYRPCM